MNVINCRHCGKMFNALGREKICPSCARKLEDKFQEVRQYLRENPKAQLDVIAKDNDVSVKQIKQWVREERLVFSEDSMVGVECEKCGKMIRSGRFCEACKGSLANTLQEGLDKPKVKATAVNKKDKKERDRMHYLQ